jgi:hypothetical protein
MFGMFDHLSSQIHLLELSIPELLAHSDPLARLEAVLETIGRLRKQKLTGAVAFSEPAAATTVTSFPSSPMPTADPSKAALSTPVSARTPIRYTPGSTTR